jgi:hypothetical protein
MKLRTALALAFSIVAVSAHAEKIALAGGTLIDPRSNEVRDRSTDPTVIIDGVRRQIVWTS